MAEQGAFCHHTDVMADAGRDEPSRTRMGSGHGKVLHDAQEIDCDEPALPHLDHTRSRETAEQHDHDREKSVMLEAPGISAGSFSMVPLEKPEFDHHIVLQPQPHRDPDQPVLFFDLDNTLYSRDLGIAEEMGERIQLYVQHHLTLPAEESRRLGHQYYLDYGLAIKGLLHNFQVDPATYDTFVDGGLQLEHKLRPDTRLIALLRRTGARRWVFTNAGIQHARRVLRLLGLEELFEGIVYCNYNEPDFPAKPDGAAFERAMRAAGVLGRPDLCWFIDDNVTNVQVSRSLGWHAVHLDEQQTELEWAQQERHQTGGERTHPHGEQLGKDCITSLYDIEGVFSAIFRDETKQT